MNVNFVVERDDPYPMSSATVGGPEGTGVFVSKGVGIGNICLSKENNVRGETTKCQMGTQLAVCSSQPLSVPENKIQT